MANRPSLWSEADRALGDLSTTLELLRPYAPGAPADGLELAELQLAYAREVVRQAAAGAAKAANLIRNAEVSGYTRRRFGQLKGE